SLREDLFRQARELGIERRFHFLGVRNDIPEILAASHIYVLTSIGSEGSSRATLEAMSVGRPVVASNVGMLTDVVHENRTGCLFPPGDARALAEKLTRLIKDKQLRNAMGLHAHLRAEQEFDENLFAQKIIELYADALRQPPA
ncbi:MAG: glycosyltransferase, partial [Planctomycetes bacterium]|nr:glycosyltransferase [Planctomycetota bacterium]